MSKVLVTFDEAAALKAVRGLLGQEVAKVAQAVAEEARRLCPRGRTGRLRRGIRSIVQDGEAVVFVPHPGRFIEYGHDIVQGGRKVGHRPPNPFLRTAILRVAASFGESWGSAVGGYAGGVTGVPGYAAYGRARGAREGRDLWSRVGAKIADMAEAGTLGESARHAAGALGVLAGRVTARRSR